MLRSLDEDTYGNYNAGLLHFTQFCDSQNISEADHMPALASLLSAFASAHAGTISDKTVSKWPASLHFWHVINHAEWNANNMLHHVHHGITKMVPPSSKCAKHPPVTLEALITLGGGLNNSSPMDSAILETLLSLHTPPSNRFLTNKDFTRFCSFHIPWTKTMKELGADISITSHPHITCPFSTLQAHFSTNSNLPSTAPLFSYEFSNGLWQALTKPNFLKCCNDIWVRASFPSMPGHGFCVSLDVIAQQGHWKPQAFLEYWCHIKCILSLFISSSSSTSRCLALDDIMLDFARCNHLNVTKTIRGQ
ncbi:hypothetical protein BS17DRAFT_797242 [Gyrodon lividus]|nr:hypothetical protein BS17DRAFT_797242 [Gyrodon lividus]